VCCAAALATIALLEEGLVENAARMGSHLMDRMREWPARFPGGGSARVGTDDRNRVGGVRVSRPGVAPGVRTRPAGAGAGDSTIRLSPPLVITRDQCDFAMETLEECLT